MLRFWFVTGVRPKVGIAANWSVRGTGAAETGLVVRMAELAPTRTPFTRAGGAAVRAGEQPELIV
jgi:hypothetical protein